jgi:hypothetical protein
MIRLPEFKLSRVDGRVQVVNDRDGLLHETDADPAISQHAVYWLVSIETYAGQRRTWIGEWRLYYHDVESCMYVLGNRAILAFRGTQDTKDLYDDLQISLGETVYPRAVEAADWVFALQSLNPDLTLEVTGHSLGGGIAREVGRVMKLTVVTFNAASPPSAPVISPGRAVDYHIVFDMISAWQSPNTVRIDKGFRPWSPLYSLTLPYLWVHHVLYGLLPSHKLENFSKRLPGNVVTAAFENDIFQKWFLSFSVSKRLYILTFLLGAAGRYDTSLPLVE